jgi:hypothetical protein
MPAAPTFNHDPAVWHHCPYYCDQLISRSALCPPQKSALDFKWKAPRQDKSVHQFGRHLPKSLAYLANWWIIDTCELHNIAKEIVAFAKGYLGFGGLKVTYRGLSAPFELFEIFGRECDMIQPETVS